jgi:hypothetical protein
MKLHPPIPAQLGRFKPGLQHTSLVVGSHYAHNSQAWQLIEQVRKALKIDHARGLCGDDLNSARKPVVGGFAYAWMLD